MEKRYKIDYYPFSEMNKYTLEIHLPFIGIIGILIVFSLIHNVFTEDLFSGIIMFIFPVTLYVIILIQLRLLKKVKITFDYINDLFIYKSIFKLKEYKLSLLEISKEENFIYIKHNKKNICVINEIDLENKTRFNYSNLIN